MSHAPTGADIPVEVDAVVVDDAADSTGKPEGPPANPPTEPTQTAVERVQAVAPQAVNVRQMFIAGPEFEAMRGAATGGSTFYGSILHQAATGQPIQVLASVREGGAHAKPLSDPRRRATVPAPAPPHTGPRGRRAHPRPRPARRLGACYGPPQRRSRGGCRRPPLTGAGGLPELPERVRDERRGRARRIRPRGGRALPQHDRPDPEVERREGRRGHSLKPRPARATSRAAV